MSDRQLDVLQRERDQYAKAVATLSSRFDEKVEELSFVRMVGDALARCTTVATICVAIVQLIQETIAPENCSVFLLDDDEIILRSAMGAFDDSAAYYEAALSPCMFVRGRGVVGQAVQQRKMLRLEDAKNDDRFEDRVNSRVVPRSILVVPLIFDERVIGIVNLSDSETGVFEARHERLLAITANFAALAFETAVLFEEVSDSRAQLQKENAVLKEQLTGHVSVKGLVGDDPKFQSVVQLMHKVADTSANVLVTGESGTGKEVFARALHSESGRRNKPFIAINCGALPESLLEAELFGIERGVATGVDARAGTFEQASGGTLFLDEIGDMALSVQVRLLRVLQERQVVRVGGSKVIDVDVRVIAATHRNLAERITEGTFRQDLYYRLKVVTLDLPSLRERPKDILTLTRFFVHRFADRHERPVPTLSTAAARALVTYDWPGNIRELEHNVEQAIILADGDVLYPDNFGLAAAERSGLALELPDHIESLSGIRQEAEELLDRALITRALSLADNNRTKAAGLLKISRRALHYKLKKLSLID
jgi:Nif-specific regulatory protein